jgi:asparagine synthase (glutamine-hydrolysing)
MCGIWGMLSLNNIQYNNNILYKAFNTIKYRGPDKSIFLTHSNYIVGFHRLSIMDTSILGDQPFKHSNKYVSTSGHNMLRTVYLTVNGEIYNWLDVKSSCELTEFCKNNNYIFQSNSDCEVILPLFLKYITNNYYSRLAETEHQNGISELLQSLDGEFAFAIHDIHYNIDLNKTYFNLWLSRDRFGIRPLFISKLNDNTIAFGSELKSLVYISGYKSITQLEPRSWYYYGGSSSSSMTEYKKHYYKIGERIPSVSPNVNNTDLNWLYDKCRKLLTKSVVDRLQSDREVGCLLSGGLDSSLVAAIASRELKKYGKVLKTFSIGQENSPDVKYAQIVANHIGSEHTNFNIPLEQWIDALKDVIYIGETFDITTVRATTGQYLISKKIAETTNIKVLLIGDGSDEATGGYLYFHKSPNSSDFHLENQRLLEWIHYYDVLRADRGIASNGLEARVPFLAHQFIDFYLEIEPGLRMPQKHTLSNGTTMVYEKYFLRKSFDNNDLLPECVLWRKKEAFSDGVSSQEKSWYKIIQEKAEEVIDDEKFNFYKMVYTQSKLLNECSVIPQTKESLYYLNIFNEFYPGQNNAIPYYWMPRWIEGVTDPSARTLEIYNNEN